MGSWCLSLGCLDAENFETSCWFLKISSGNVWRWQVFFIGWTWISHGNPCMLFLRRRRRTCCPYVQESRVWARCAGESMEVQELHAESLPKQALSLWETWAALATFESGVMRNWEPPLHYKTPKEMSETTALATSIVFKFSQSLQRVFYKNCSSSIEFFLMNLMKTGPQACQTHGLIPPCSRGMRMLKKKKIERLVVGPASNRLLSLYFMANCWPCWSASGTLMM